MACSLQFLTKITYCFFFLECFNFYFGPNFPQKWRFFSLEKLWKWGKFHKNDVFFNRKILKMRKFSTKMTFFLFLFAKSGRRFRPWSAQFPTKMTFFLFVLRSDFGRRFWAGLHNFPQKWRFFIFFFVEETRKTFIASTALFSTKMSLFSFFCEWEGRGMWLGLHNFPQKWCFFIYFFRSEVSDHILAIFYKNDVFFYFLRKRLGMDRTALFSTKMTLFFIFCCERSLIIFPQFSTKMTFFSFFFLRERKVEACG